MHWLEFVLTFSGCYRRAEFEEMQRIVPIARGCLYRHLRLGIQNRREAALTMCSDVCLMLEEFQSEGGLRDWDLVISSCYGVCIFGGNRLKMHHHH